MFDTIRFIIIIIIGAFISKPKKWFSWQPLKSGEVRILHRDKGYKYTQADLFGCLQQGVLDKPFAYSTSIDLWKQAADEPTYFQTLEEKNILEKFSTDIADRIEQDSTIIDMGAGNPEKTLILRRELVRRGVKCTYVCIDLSEASVRLEVNNLQNDSGSMDIGGLVGTFEDGLQRYLCKVPGQRVCLWLGSTLFNDTTPSVSPIVKDCRNTMRPGTSDFMVVGQDCHQREDSGKIRPMYHSRGFQGFINGAVAAANTALGQPEVLVKTGCSLEFSETHLTHVHTLEVRDRIQVGSQCIPAGKQIRFFPSHKPTARYFQDVLRDAGFDSEPMKAGDNNSYIFLVELRDPIDDQDEPGHDKAQVLEQPPAGHGTAVEVDVCNLDADQRG